MTTPDIFQYSDDLSVPIEIVTVFSESEFLPPFSILIRALQFYTLEKRIPSVSEVYEYILNLDRMERDPERYYQETKHALPTPNLSNLKPMLLTEEKTCGICLEDLSKNTEAYLLPCGHSFHSSASDCLDKTVVDWLSENRQCPTCRTEVKL